MKFPTFWNIFSVIMSWY